MAVLVGVLAPAYLRYVEKARKQTCYTNMDSVVREVQLLAYSDPDFMDDLVQAVATAPNGNLLTFAGGYVSIPDCPSNGEYKLTFDESTGVLTMTCTMEVHSLPSQGGVGGEGTETP